MRNTLAGVVKTKARARLRIAEFAASCPGNPGKPLGIVKIGADWRRELRTHSAECVCFDNTDLRDRQMRKALWHG